MPTIEIEAKTTKEAIEIACKHFSSTEDELNIEILKNKSISIFGIIGSKKVKIKATPKTDNSPLLIARDTLKKITLLMSVDTEISAEKKDGNIFLNIQGNSSGILIGYKGKTLEALEFIVNKAVNKAYGKKIRVIIDSENYKEKKEKSLKELALKMSEKVKKTGKVAVINPKSPYDRRIIHLALKNDYEVQTRSKGEGLFKKILIIPK
ncbi:MAG: RNA-binding cell elongation regulator Jag/EloR [Thermodesulfobacteriota bacterium]|nr:RNA-binding cell elongation regulator Jag/EloR [Thermodesulfobacteriota bacterium]